MTLIWRKRTDPGVVASVEEQTTQAARLAEIDGQDRLVDPRTNPAVRPMVDELRNAQHRLVLEAEHGRTKRRHRVTDRRAADAERTLEAILRARQASSPARSVLALHRGRTRFMTTALAASVILSAGSAAGVEQLASEKGAPALTGYVAEIGMVGLSTLAILYRAHLSQHGWEGDGWKKTALWVMAVVPLLASVVANAMGAGPVGVACSVGAAAFGVFSHLIGDASSEALLAKAREVSGEDEKGLRAVAMGDDLFSAPPTAGKPLEAAPPQRPVICSTPGGFLPLRRPTPKPVGNRLGIPTTPVGAPVPEPVSTRPSEVVANHPGATGEPVANRPDGAVGNQQDGANQPAGNHPGSAETNRVETTGETTPGPGRPGGNRTTNRAGGNRTPGRSGRPQAEENTEAVDLYRQSVKDGAPMSQRVLANKFNRSTAWARARIAEAGLQPVGNTGQPVEKPAADADDDHETNRVKTAKEATG